MRIVLRGIAGIELMPLDFVVLRVRRHFYRFSHPT
jgi:hypothetical protein